MKGAGPIRRVLPPPVVYWLRWIRTAAGRRRAGRQLRVQLGSGFNHRLGRERAGAGYQAAFDEREPEVTLIITTYNRWDLLSRRALPSARAQDYRNLEILVIGDACNDGTERGMAEVRDSRVRFVNLSARGEYPGLPHLRWMVAGTKPANHGLEIARGRFITHLDDDDEHAPERISRLVAAIQRQRADLVWHPFFVESETGNWHLNSARPFAYGCVTTSSILYHAWLRHVPWDPDAYRHGQPGDWNRMSKFRYLKAKMIRYPEPLLWHYRERNQRTP